jgi:iron complex outermembrane recepter protein
MFQKTRLCKSLVVAFGGGMILASGSAFAQERVEITGSRIKTVQTEGTSPVVVLGKEAIQLEGVRNAEQLLNNLPQVFADQGGSVSNGATGAATVNLRNLGSNRTLVLINGRRLPGGSPRDISTDLNQIPVSLIKRVEILTGGASAIYGSDAVAGVVNFILDDKFEGVQIDLNHEFYNHSQHTSQGVKDANTARGFALPGDVGADGKITDFSLTLGGNFADGKGNAVLFFAHKTEDAVTEDSRDFSNCALGAAGGVWTCGGSSTAFPGRFIDLTNGGDWSMGTDGSIHPFGAADQYNYAPSNFFQRPSDRYSVQALAHYDIADYARVYGEFGFHDDHTVAQIAPSGIFLGGFVTTVDFSNPLLTDAWRQTLNLNAPGDTADLFIGRRNVEGGGRQDDIRHTSYRGVIGLKGDISDSWSYDVSALVGKVLFQEVYHNDFSNTRLLRALDVVDDGAGNAVCRAFLDGTDTNCVPYNIWTPGGVTPGSLAYLQTPGFQKGFTSTEVINASINGDLTGYGVKSPWAKSGLGLAFGVEHRTEEMELTTDQAFTTGDLAGQGGPTIGVAGAFDVTDVFTEARMPLVEKAPWAELLALNASYRYSDYSTGKKTSTWGLGLEWAPINEMKIRASAQRASRAANIIELFSQAALGLYDNETGDPCAGATPEASLEQCANSGVTAAQYGHILGNPAGQYNAVFGGNTQLNPETSKSWTVGFVVNPIRDMNLTLDWFHIHVDDIIGNIPPTAILNDCLNTGNPFTCGLIHRSELTGDLWTGVVPTGGFINATNLNLSFKETEGLDFGADYSLKLEGMGRVDFAFKGTWLKKFEAEDAPGFGSYDCAGYYGATCGTPAPKWRHSLRTTWRSPWNVDLSLNWRHIDEVKNEGLSSDPHLNITTDPLVSKLKAIDYFDIAASYKATKNITLSAAVNNILDTDPPLRNNGAGFVNGNTYPVVYDALGRRVSLTLNAKF